MFSSIGYSRFDDDDIEPVQRLCAPDLMLVHHYPHSHFLGGGEGGLVPHRRGGTNVSTDSETVMRDCSTGIAPSIQMPIMTKSEFITMEVLLRDDDESEHPTIYASAMDRSEDLFNRRVFHLLYGIFGSIPLTVCSHENFDNMCDCARWLMSLYAAEHLSPQDDLVAVCLAAIHLAGKSEECIVSMEMAAEAVWRSLECHIKLFPMQQLLLSLPAKETIHKMEMQFLCEVIAFDFHLRPNLRSHLRTWLSTITEYKAEDSDIPKEILTVIFKAAANLLLAPDLILGLGPNKATECGEAPYLLALLAISAINPDMLLDDALAALGLLENPGYHSASLPQGSLLLWSTHGAITKEILHGAVAKLSQCLGGRDSERNREERRIVSSAIRVVSLIC